MSDIAIRVQGLGKRYLIGSHGARLDYKTLREFLTEVFAAPVRRIAFSRNGRGSDDRRGGDEYIWALRDLYLEVNKGQVLGIIGPNGAGKTTLLKILSRITYPTTGRAEIFGRVRALLEVGTGFHPELTGRENIYLNGAILGMRRAEIDRKLDEIVAFAEIGKFLDTPVKRYSSGMQVRLAFAVAAHLETDILIVDEVLAVGDMAFQRKCMGKMGDVAHQGKTVLLVSHNMSAIRQLCQEAIVLKEGKITIRDSAERAVVAYMNEGVSKIEGERVWTPEEQKAVKGPFVPLAVRVRNHLGVVSNRISSRESFAIEVEYILPEGIRELRVGIGLYFAGGDCILWSYDQDEPETYTPSITLPGHYRAVCHFPADWLNGGSYYVAFYAGRPITGSIWLPLNALQFEIDTTNGLGSHLGFQGTRPGFLRPKLDWKIESANLEVLHA